MRGSKRSALARPGTPAGRRRFLQATAAPLASWVTTPLLGAARTDAPVFTRVRPGDAGWPSDSTWQRLGTRLAGKLVKVSSPWPECVAAPRGAACAALFRQVKNPYFLGDEVALTQTLGWVDAWTSAPSAYAVMARSTADVAAAVDFAREHRLRLVVKGGGHSYQGTSNAPDSLLVWTRSMRDATLHDAFVPQGCAG